MRQSEGVIVKRGRYKHRARITINGKEYSRTFSSAASAEEWLLQLRRATSADDLLHRLYVDQLLVSDVITRFRDEVASHRPSAEARRRELSRCKFLLEQQPQLSGMKAAQLQARHIVSYLAHRRAQGATNGSLRAELAIIRRAYTLAGGPWGLGLDQPVKKGLMPDPPPSRERRLSADEYEALMKAAHAYENSLGGKERIPIGAIIEFAIQTAMRRGEIATLSWDRIVIFTDGFGIATLPQLRTKTLTTREVPLTPDLVEILLQLPSAAARTGSVFGASNGAIGTAWSRVLKLAGLYLSKKDAKILKAQNPRNDVGLRLHDLRHEGTSRYFELYGLQKLLVQSITGHGSEAMNDRYAHLEARPLILRRMREVYAEQHPDYKPSNDTGGAPQPRATAGKPIAVVPGVIKVNPKWKALRRNAEALQAAILEQPIIDLADAMGVSDVAIHKACAKLRVQKPGRGHWLKQPLQPDESSET